jgi:hypothetical protein
LPPRCNVVCRNHGSLLARIVLAGYVKRSNNSTRDALTAYSSFDGRSTPPSHLSSKLLSSLRLFGLYGGCKDRFRSKWKLPRHSLFDCCKLDTHVDRNSNITADTKQRTVVLTGLRIRSFNSEAFAIDPTLAEAEYIAWTQWELTYAVLASTFPSAQRSFLDLVTYYNNNGDYTKPSKRQSVPASKSIQLNTLNANGTSAGSTPNGSGPDADDDDDDDDDSSQRMIIMKSQTYEVVTHDAASAMEPVARGMAIHDRQEMVDRDWGPIESKTTTSS